MMTACPLLDCLTRRVHTQPDSIAVVAPEGPVSYAELGRMADAAATHSSVLSTAGLIAVRIANLATRQRLSTAGGALSLAAVDRYTDWVVNRFDLRPGTVVLNHAPLDSGLSLLDVWATLKAGGTIVLVPPDRRTDGRWLGDVVRAQGVEVLHGIPELFQALLDTDRRAAFASVRRVIATGDAVTPDLFAGLPHLFPWAGIYHLYGPTSTSRCFLHEVGHDIVDGTLPIGQPLPGVETMLVNDQGTVLNGPGSGELWVRTPFGSDRAGWQRSGHVVRRDTNGSHFLVGCNAFSIRPNAGELAA